MAPTTELLPADRDSLGRVIDSLRAEAQDRKGAPLGGLFHDLAIELEDLQGGGVDA